MSTKTCPFCGQSIEGNLKFCPNCGNSLEAFGAQSNNQFASQNGPAAGAQAPYTDAFTESAQEAPRQVSAWFVCPKCGASHEVYGDGVNPPKFGVCYNCGYREGDYINPASAPGYSREMPGKGPYTTFLVFGFIFGILWGFLALNNYRRMNAAIQSGDADTAWANARKVRMFFFIGLAVNVGVLLLSILGNLVG